jgi:hypothetical protein
MFALVDAKDVPEGGFLRRLRRRVSGRAGVNSGYQEILGMKTFCLTFQMTGGLTPRDIRKQVLAAAEAIRGSGCEEICFSKIFPYRDELLREGFVEIDDGILYERLAGNIALRFSGRDKSAVLFAKRLSHHSERALKSLCEGFRYVMADIEAGGGRVIERLAKQYGVSIIERPSARQLANADTAVFFSPPAQQIVLPDRCVAVAVSKEALTGVTCSSLASGLKIALKHGKALNLPEKYPINSIAAAAMKAGTVFPGEIELLEVSITALERRLDKETGFHYN